MARNWRQIWYTDRMIWHKIHHWFIPHRDTHKKAHLISWEALLIYVLFFMALQVGFSIVGFANPGILGISGNIDQKKLIELTNKERQNKGLPAVSENEALDKAAEFKARNMFEENYWAHFAPSGKTPWDFILGTGYRFTFAGENLAKNFYSSDEVVAAWMASPTHRDNLLNAKYKDIGIAVVEGVLNGQKTTLVVQEFGTTEYLAGGPTVAVQGKTIAVPSEDFFNRPALVASALQTAKSTKPLLDPFKSSKTAGYSIIILISFLLMVDLWVLKRRGVFRISSQHIAHVALLSLAAGSLYISNPGAVL